MDPLNNTASPPSTDPRLFLFKVSSATTIIFPPGPNLVPYSVPPNTPSIYYVLSRKSTNTYYTSHTYYPSQVLSFSTRTSMCLTEYIQSTNTKEAPINPPIIPPLSEPPCNIPLSEPLLALLSAQSTPPSRFSPILPENFSFEKPPGAHTSRPQDSLTSALTS